MTTLTVTDSRIPSFVSKFYSKFNTIQEAIDHASDGDIIEVETGIYDEQLVINKSIAIIGLGKRDDFVIRGDITIQANGTVDLENASLNHSRYGVLIKHGYMHIENCVISDMHEYGILVQDEAELFIQNSFIRNSETGINIYGKAKIEACKITKNQGDFQLVVNENAEANISQTEIASSDNGGINYCSGSSGAIQQCQLYENAGTQISISLDSRVKITDSQIYDGRSYAIFVDQGHATIYHCKIRNHIKSQIMVKNNGTLYMEKSRLYNGAQQGLFIRRSEVSISNCDIYKNGKKVEGRNPSQIYGTDESRVHLSRTTIRDGQGIGVRLVESSNGSIENCTISGHESTQLIFRSNSKGVISHSTIRRGSASGIYVNGASVEVNDCKLSEHTNPQLYVISQAHLHMTNSKVFTGESNGVVVKEDSHAVMENCHIHGHITHPQLFIETSKFELKDSEVNNSGSEGLFLTKDANATVLSCHIYDNNGNSQIGLKENSELKLETSNISNGARGGVSSSESIVHIEGCEFTRNGKNDEDGTTSQVNGNNRSNIHLSNSGIKDGPGIGVRLVDSSTGNMENCIVSGHESRQLTFRSNSKAVISHSTIRKGSRSGIYVNGASVEVSDSKLSEHTNPQLYVTTQAHLHMINSEVFTSESNGAVVREDSHAIMENCHIHGNIKHPQVFIETSKFEMKDSEVNNSGSQGLFLTKNATATVLDCQIHDNNGNSQVRLREDSEIKLETSKIYNGAHYGVFSSESTVYIEGCEFERNGSENEDIITSQINGTNQSHIHLTESSIKDGPGIGVRLVDSSTGNMENCVISGHESRQVIFRDNSKGVISDSTILSGASDGVYVNGASVEVNDCELSDHASPQMFFEGEGDGTIKGCKLHNGKTNSLVIRETSVVNVENSDFYDHLYSGYPLIAVLDDGMLNLKDSKVRDNKVVGILIETKNKATVEDCYIYNNLVKNQIEINNAKDITLKNNRIVNGEDYGINVYESNPIIEKCLIDGHSLDAIFTDEDSKPVLIDNNLQKKNQVPQQTKTPITKQSEEQIDERGLQELLEELDRYIGLHSVKKSIKEIINLVEINRYREERGLVANVPVAPHMVFLGSPGTGKTTMGRLVGDIFREMGLLSKGQLIEVKREDLVGEFIGQSEKITKAKIEEALGGVLFIDEAYALSQGSSQSSNDFGLKVIDILVPALENHRGELMVIAAGYTEEMEQFLSSNPGLKDRFTERIHFEDYTPDELLEIFHKMSHEEGYELNEQAETLLYEELIELYRKRDRTFGNARLVRNYLTNFISAHSTRVTKVPKEQWDDKLLVTLTEDDINHVLAKKERKSFNVPINEELLAEKLKELNQLIGLEKVKQEIDRLVQLIRYYKEQGSETKQLINHILLLGNPGTGKTEVGRILSGIYEALGLLERGELIETDRNGLVSKYLGSTEEKTMKQIENAIGSTLFIDEAYSLTNKGSNDPGHTAVEILLKQMSDLEGEFMVIAAGYDYEMKQFLDSNSGLRRRFGLTLEFEDYTPEELLSITKLYLDDYTLSADANVALERHYEYLYEKRDNTFGNAGLARKIATESIKNLDYRMSQLEETDIKNDMKVTIEEMDVALLES